MRKFLSGLWKKIKTFTLVEVLFIAAVVVLL